MLGLPWGPHSAWSAALVAVVECLALPVALGSPLLPWPMSSLRISPWRNPGGPAGKGKLRQPGGLHLTLCAHCPLLAGPGGLAAPAGGAPMGGLWFPPSQTPPSGQGRGGSAPWGPQRPFPPSASAPKAARLPLPAFCPLSRGLVFRIVVQKYGVKLKAEQFVLGGVHFFSQGSGSCDKG